MSLEIVPRFKVGDPVKILPTMTVQFSRMVGVITAIDKTSPYSNTLDKYNVTLSDGTEHIFWDIQLKLKE